MAAGLLDADVDDVSVMGRLYVMVDCGEVESDGDIETESDAAAVIEYEALADKDGALLAEGDMLMAALGVPDREGNDEKELDRLVVFLAVCVPFAVDVGVQDPIVDALACGVALMKDE